MLTECRLIVVRPRNRRPGRPLAPFGGDRDRIESHVAMSNFPVLELGPDPIIEAYKHDVDRTLIRENLGKSHEERILALQRMQAFVDELRTAKKTRRDR